MICFKYSTNFSLDDELSVIKLLRSVALSNRKEIKKFFFYFVSEEEILKVNNNHLNHNFVTDVITFDYSEGKDIKAEAYICPSEVFKNARIYKQTLENEVVRVVLHALLHVVGYDDKTNERKQEMRKQEDSYLAVFKKKHK
tara:strand:+ start:1563 stop:1985 length:423 start_codon:yes stop_codon:yes gene_type:complete